MDFVPRTLENDDFIFVVIDCFFKIVHFIPYTKILVAYTIVKLYFDEIIKLYDLLKL
jgi:hypothetical protein